MDLQSAYIRRFTSECALIKYKQYIRSIILSLHSNLFWNKNHRIDSVTDWFRVNKKNKSWPAWRESVRFGSLLLCGLVKLRDVGHLPDGTLLNAPNRTRINTIGKMIKQISVINEILQL